MRRWLNVACATGLLLGGCSGSDDAVDTAPVGDDDNALATALACLPLDADGWSPSETSTSALDMVSVAANDGAVVVVGAVRTGGIVALRSADGVEWEQAIDFPAVTDVGMPPEVAGRATGFVAIGTLDGATPNAPVVAFSPDGSVWEQADPASLPASEVAWLSDVFAGPDGFLIVGSHLPNELLAWYSDDGRTWLETDLPRSELDVAAVAPNSSGWVALTGEFGVGAGEELPPVRVWTSPDGMQWSETETRSVPPPEALMAYVGTAPLTIQDDVWMLALRGEGDVGPGAGGPVVWVSTDDGVTWAEHHVGSEVATSGFAIYDTAATEFGMLLAGSQDTPFDGDGSFLHHSLDGVVWQPCWTDPRAITEVEPFGDALVAFDSESGDLYVWKDCGCVTPVE